MQPLFRCLAVTAVFLAFAGHCYAEALPDAGFSGAVSILCGYEPPRYFTISEPGTIAGSASCSEVPGHWSGSATVSGENHGTLGASLSANGYGYANSAAGVHYWFTLVGGETGSKVPVTIETKGSETWSGGGTSFNLVFTISSANGDEYYTVVYDPGIHFSSFDSLSTFDFVVGKQYYAALQVNVLGQGTYDSGPADGSQSLFLDPVYTPAEGSGVTIAFSPNLVPEPACWAMLITGVPLIGMRLRRRLRLA